MALFPQQPPISARTRLLGVVGWPVEHSLSPQIHNAALRAAGLDYVYLAFAVPPARFEAAVRGLAAAGAVGLNCTVPHKHAALAACDEVSATARAVGAVNTIHFRADGVYGTNTDVEGYVESLRHDAGFEFVGRRVVQFGAGGAGRGMALGTLQAGAARLVIVNRTLTRAEALAADLTSPDLFPEADVTALSPEADADAVRRALADADLVANATSLGLNEEDAFPCPAEVLAQDCVVFDAAYTPQRSTAWLRAASRRGRRTLDGFGMLVRQGAAAFRLWTGVEPDLKVMFAALPGWKQESET